MNNVNEHQYRLFRGVLLPGEDVCQLNLDNAEDVPARVHRGESVVVGVDHPIISGHVTANIQACILRGLHFMSVTSCSSSVHPAQLQQSRQPWQQRSRNRTGHPPNVASHIAVQTGDTTRGQRTPTPAATRAMKDDHITSLTNAPTTLWSLHTNFQKCLAKVRFPNSFSASY